MKKIIVITLGIGIVVFGMYKFIQFRIDQSYELGRKSVTLKDLCADMEWAGTKADYTTGEANDWVKCKTNIRHNVKFQDDWVVN